MIILIRSNEVNPDPRLQKYIDFLEKEKIEYKVLGWNRTCEKINLNNKYIFFNRNAPYGAKYKNIKNKLAWFKFVFDYLIKNRHKYDIIHACDFDTACPAYFAKLFTSKKIIFDVFDLTVDYESRGLLARSIKIIEKNIMKKADYLIICEKERKEQIGIKRKDILVMPNIPSNNIKLDKIIENKINKIKQNLKCKLVVSYVGVFDTSRGLENLLEVVANNKDIMLNIAGFGYLSKEVERYSIENKNILYWGKVDYNTGLNIMKNSNLIVGMYYRKAPVHRFAAPNKYYESLMLKVPIITTEGTLIGTKVKEYDTGFVIGETIEDIKFILDEISDLEIEYKSNKCCDVWEKKYKQYIEGFMKDIYSKIIMEDK